MLSGNELLETTHPDSSSVPPVIKPITVNYSRVDVLTSSVNLSLSTPSFQKFLFYSVNLLQTNIHTQEHVCAVKVCGMCLLRCATLKKKKRSYRRRGINQAGSIFLFKSQNYLSLRFASTLPIYGGDRRRAQLQECIVI